MHYKYTYELIDPEKNHKKFWSITGPISFEGHLALHVVCRFGRIGKNKVGQSMTFLFSSATKAAKFMAAKRQQKEREGYVLKEQAEVDQHETRLTVEVAPMSVVTKGKDFSPDDESMFELE